MGILHSIDVWRMGELMQNYDNSEDKVKQFWVHLNEKIAEEDNRTAERYKDKDRWKAGGTTESPYDKNPRTDEQASYTEVYLLAFVAAICEKSIKGEVSSAELLEMLENKYHLNTIMNLHGSKKFHYFLMSIANNDNDGKWIHTKRQKENCKKTLDRIQDYISDWSVGLNTTLDVLLEKIEKSNKRASETLKKDDPNAKQERRIDQSIKSFKQWLAETAEKYPVPQAEKHPIPQSVSEIREFYEQKKGKSKLKDNSYFKDICKQIESGVKQIILTGAPGTGKTFLAGEVASCLGWPTDEENDYERVIFHPSYDYTDFVEGLRPVKVKDNQDKGTDKDNNNNNGNQFFFAKLDGSFKNFCREAVAANNADRVKGMTPEAIRMKRYFFLIDEINRADISKVFGELMFCLEVDKRVSVDSDEKQKKACSVLTQYQGLPTYGLKKTVKVDEDFKAHEAAQATGNTENTENTETAENKKNSENNNEVEDVFAKRFYIPENVYIIGTMNDIDRSVESMDFALRRRFTWIEVKVDRPNLIEAFKSKNFGNLLGNDSDDYKAAKEAADRIMKLNNLIYPERKNENGTSNNGGNTPNEERNEIFFDLSKQHYISQGQFSGLPDEIKDGNNLDDLFNFVWQKRIEPLLREYVRGEDEEKVEEFIGKCQRAFAPKLGEETKVSGK